MPNKHVLCMQIAVVSLLVTPAVQAHTLVSAENSWFAGLAHPLLGVDHLLVMLAIGLWASQQRKDIWRLPGVFLAVMLFGAILGGTGWPLPLLEAGIAGSMVVLGLLLMFAIRLPTMPSILLVGLFALLHGYAHGAEVPQSSGQTGYLMGLMFSTAALNGVGIGTGVLAKWMRNESLLRLGGFAIGLTGAWMWI